MWGAADQARVNRYILEEQGCELVALIDDTPNLTSPFPNVPLFNGLQNFLSWLRDKEPEQLGFVIAIANPYGHVRCRMHQLLVSEGLVPISLVDPSAKICASASIGPGLQAMAGTIVHNDARVERQCILNTRSLVEHDCILEEGVELGPGAVLAGRVQVGAYSTICTGASVCPRIRIGRNVIVGAGSVVISDVPDGAVVVGVPAKRILRWRSENVDPS